MKLDEDAIRVRPSIRADRITVDATDHCKLSRMPSHETRLVSIMTGRCREREREREREEGTVHTARPEFERAGESRRSVGLGGRSVNV